jgi:hypothetical protein
MSSKVAPFPLVIGLLAALLLGACSSKNPDSLIGMNLDENLAIMNADENAGAEVTAPNVSANETSSAARSSTATTANANEVNAARTAEENPPDESETGANQAGNEGEQPNGV